MTKELQDLAWSRLPKEFKEEVKRYYQVLREQYNGREKTKVFRYLFGDYNLTSDVEGEEMLTVEKSRVQQQYNRANQLQGDSDPKWNLVGDQIARVLSGLFGSKCLPDDVSVDSLKVREFININELDVDKFVKSEPKFKVGDKVKIIGAGTEASKARIGYVGEIVDIDPRDFACFVLYPKGQDWIRSCDLEPYTEPKEDHIGENTEMVKDFDTILKDSFSKERRLNIAATILGNIIQSGYYSLSEKYRKENMSEMAKLSLQLTDALIVAMKSATERIP